MTTACYKLYSMTVASETQAWWAMETATPLAQDDSVTGLQLTKAFGTDAHFSKQPGLIGECEQIHDVGAIFDELESPDVAQLKFNGVAFTFIAWVNFTLVAPMLGGGSNFSLSYNFDQNAINYNSSMVNEGAGNWTATFNGFTLLSRPAAAGWHFLVLTFNAVTSTLGFEIDQLGAVFSPVVPIAPGPNVSGLISISTSLLNPAEDIIVQYDELALFDRILTAAQLNYLYNAGAGRTWPVILP